MAPMNAARLARRWQEAAGDPARMAEALVDEINDSATGLVTRDFLRAKLADLRSELREEMAGPRGELAARYGQETPGAADVRHSQWENEVLAFQVAARRVLPWRTIWIGLGIQVVIVTIMTMILFQVLR